MIEKHIKQNLMQLQSAISRADGDAIGSAIRELDQAAADHGRDLDPQLLHFLRNRSYQKALAFLGGDEDIPAGVCGGGKR